uniref:Lipase domain-containing protein n=1 Tax=Heliothis virescens TaxID=7102 RepID=A0A2A4J5Z0_HELVI
MSRLAWLLTALCLTVASAQLNILNKIKKDLTKEVQAVVDPLGKGIAFIGSSQCSTVKRLVGVSYDAFNKEPDMSKLTLVFTTTGFNPNNPFRIFLHGFIEDPTKNSYKEISNAFLAQGDCNILALDASSLIRWLYLRSTTMTRFIGEKLGAMLAALVNAGLDPSNIHLIGHSLGSHIAGFTGKTFRNLTGTLIGWISGLDPAGPCFGDVEVPCRLNKDDAQFVDVIHTDDGVYGLDEQIGHVDFYPNSGSEQPNCLFQTCSHSRAWLLYAESVLSRDAFLGVKCATYEDFRKGLCDYNDTRIMGYFSSPEVRGKYFLQTSDDMPYGRKSEGLKSISVTYNLSDAARLIPQSRGFNPNNPFRIFLHGFTDDPTKDSYKNISNAFLAQGDCNILALDASSLIRWLYLRSTTMTRFIGEKLGGMLAALVNAGVDPSNIHLIGHSLGSHISGFTGKTFRNLTGTLIGRISGLDPAGPCFADLEVPLRLSKEDAEFVDIIHTDAGVYGLDEQIGHVDFYPNSGSEQPNCLFQTCSHSRAWLLYAESVLSRDAFLGVKCATYEDFRKGQCDYNDTRIMGYFCPPDSSGDCNILALDASSLIRWLYLRSTTMTRFIGEKLGGMLAALVNAGVDPSNIHLIGHSLGSHISGFTGKTFRNLTGTLIGRISGLDPAGPCFADLEVPLRLSKEDAEFVDIIHTDAGVYGLDEQIGHVDFYPNSGSEQPNCLFQTCSHSRAWLLYAESVLSRDAFLGVKCATYEDFRKGQCDYNDTRIMGYFCPPDSSGKFYLQTADEIPYGRGSEGLKYVNNAGIVRNIKYVLTG